jgi:homoserine dehydrogenase
MNAVLVKGDAVGATLYYGAGAGAEPTASAVVADVVDVVRVLTSDPENRVPHLAFQPDSIVEMPVLTAEEITTSYYLRLNVEDKPGVLAQVTKILADYQINIEAIIQKEPRQGEASLPIILLTQQTLEKEMNAAIVKIEALPTLIGKVNRIRMETLG